MYYNVKDTALRFASFEADTEAVTWCSGERSFGRHRSRAFGKTNTALQCEMFRFFDTSFEVSVSNITLLVICIKSDFLFYLVDKTKQFLANSLYAHTCQ